MAQVPYQPFPTVQPEGVPARSHDYEEIHADPNAFAAPARALRVVGAEGEQASERIGEALLARQSMTNEMTANDANTQATQAIAKRFAQFQGLEGQAAAAGLDDFQKDVLNIYNSTVKSLPNPQAQMMASRSMRYIGDYYLRAGTSYADQQHRVWMDKSATDSANNWLFQAANSVSSPDDFRIALDTAASEYRKLPEQHGMDAAGQDAEVRKFIGQNLPKIIGDVAKSGDIGRAEAIYAAYKDRMDAAGQYAATSLLKPYLAAEKGASFVDQAFSSAPSAAPPDHQTANVNRIADAIHGQESGGRATAPTSVAGAVGPMQIEPKTFAQYAKPGESITNPADNLAVGQRIIADYAQRYDNDPSRIAVAYFSGPGNVAPKDSPTPWIADTKDATGKSVSSYVSDVVGRLGAQATTAGSSPSGGVLAFDPNHRADLLGRIDELTRGQPPEVRAAAYTELKRRFDVQDAAYTDQERAIKLQKDQDAQVVQKREQQYRSALIGPNPGTITAAQIVNDPAFGNSEAGREAQDRLIALMSGTGAAASRLSHATAVDLINRMTLPENDPNRVSDMGPIDRAYGDSKLTNADYQFVSKRFLDARTPDGDVLQKREAEFIKGVTPLIDKSNPLMGQIDPSGPQKMYMLQWDIDQKIAAYRKAGKDPFDLFDPSKPDYLGKPEALKPYQKSMQESLRDRTQALTGTAVAPAASTNGSIAPLPPANRPPPEPGETAEAYMKRLGL